MKQNKVAKTALAVLFAGMALASAPSHAAIINSLFTPGVNTMQDTDAERIQRNGVSLTSGGYATGDVIQSILRFDTVNSGTIGDSIAAPYQLNAYSQLRVAQIIDLNGGALLLGDSIRLIFGAVAGFGTGGAVLAQLYEGNAVPSNNFTLSAATGISNITTGQTLIGELGLNGIDDFWFADTINDISILAAATPGGGQAAQGAFGLSFLSNAGGIPFVTNGMLSAIDGNRHDVVGDASVYAREQGTNSDWLLSSNLNATFAVPEPTTLGLLGLGLLGLGLGGRRRDKA